MPTRRRSRSLSGCADGREGSGPTVKSSRPPAAATHAAGPSHASPTLLLPLSISGSASPAPFFRSTFSN